MLARVFVSAVYDVKVVPLFVNYSSSHTANFDLTTLAIFFHKQHGFFTFVLVNLKAISAYPAN